MGGLQVGRRRRVGGERRVCRPGSDRRHQLQILNVLGAGAIHHLEQDVRRGTATVRGSDELERVEEVVVTVLDRRVQASQTHGVHELAVVEPVFLQLAGWDSRITRFALEEGGLEVEVQSCGHGVVEHEVRVDRARDVVVQVATLGHLLEESDQFRLAAFGLLEPLGG